MEQSGGRDAELPELGPLEFWTASEFDPDLIQHSLDWYHAADHSGLAQPVQYHQQKAQPLPGAQQQQQLPGAAQLQQQQQQQALAHMPHLAPLVPGHDQVGPGGCAALAALPLLLYSTAHNQAHHA